MEGQSRIIKIFKHIMRAENREGEGECYQVNSGVQAKYSDKERRSAYKGGTSEKGTVNGQGQTTARNRHEIL